MPDCMAVRLLPFAVGKSLCLRNGNDEGAAWAGITYSRRQRSTIPTATRIMSAIPAFHIANGVVLVLIGELLVGTMLVIK